MSDAEKMAFVDFEDVKFEISQMRKALFILTNSLSEMDIDENSSEIVSTLTSSIATLSVTLADLVQGQ